MADRINSDSETHIRLSYQDVEGFQYVNDISGYDFPSVSVSVYGWRSALLFISTMKDQYIFSY